LEIIGAAKSRQLAIHSNLVARHQLNTSVFNLGVIITDILQEIWGIVKSSLQITG
jgi:hypothetical protein